MMDSNFTFVGVQIAVDIAKLNDNAHDNVVVLASTLSLSLLLRKWYC
jgi:hypothetical protein